MLKTIYFVSVDVEIYTFLYLMVASFTYKAFQVEFFIQSFEHLTINRFLTRCTRSEQCCVVLFAIGLILMCSIFFLKDLHIQHI